MGGIAEQFADHVVITLDNPRTESPEQIVGDIVRGLKHRKAHVEWDRRQAISDAIRQASPADIVLIAGKGHESVQIVGEERIPFDDAEAVCVALSACSNI